MPTTNVNRLPLGSVIVFAQADRCSLPGYASNVTTFPAASICRETPATTAAPGAGNSTVQVSSFTSTNTLICGFDHSVRVIAPFSVIVRETSYCAAVAWWPNAADANRRTQI